MPAGRAVKTATRPNGAVLMTARFVVGHRAGRHVLIENGEVVFDDGAIVFVGRGYGGPVARRIDYGLALIGPGQVWHCDSVLFRWHCGRVLSLPDAAVFHSGILVALQIRNAGRRLKQQGREDFGFRFRPG